jgi:hypothetical protein
MFRVIKSVFIGFLIGLVGILGFFGGLLLLSLVVITLQYIFT